VPHGDLPGSGSTRRELPVDVRVSLTIWLPVVVAGLAAAAFGVIGGLQGGRVVMALVGLLGLALAAGAILRPPTLVLDPAGLSLRTPVGVRWRVTWASCGPFRAWRDSVVWESQAEAAAHPRRAASWRKRAQADAGVAAQFGGLSAADLAALLNSYRTASPAR